MSMLLLGTLAAGAASGAMGGLMNKGSAEVTPKFAEEQKPLLATAGAATQPINQLMYGQDPLFLRKMLANAKGMALKQARGQLSDYLRTIGQRAGGDYGPAAISGMADIYKGISPAVMQAVNAIRASATQQAFQTAGQWGMISPQGTSTEQKGGPSMGESIGAGMLGGLSQGLGGMANAPKTAMPMSPARQAVPNQTLPPAMQGPVRPGIQLQEGITKARRASMPSPFGAPIPGLMAPY